MIKYIKSYACHTYYREPHTEMYTHTVLSHTNLTHVVFPKKNLKQEKNVREKHVAHLLFDSGLV